MGAISAPTSIRLTRLAATVGSPRICPQVMETDDQDELSRNRLEMLCLFRAFRAQRRGNIKITVKLLSNARIASQRRFLPMRRPKRYCLTSINHLPVLGPSNTVRTGRTALSRRRQVSSCLTRSR